jgi:hypothetical protein
MLLFHASKEWSAKSLLRLSPWAGLLVLMVHPPLGLAATLPMRALLAFMLGTSAEGPGGFVIKKIVATINAAAIG